MKERKIWFVTRPERDPRFHVEALGALKLATDGFKIKWRANREIQKKYEQVLAEAGLKRDNISSDGSGGRTWAAMLKTFAYVYQDAEGFLRLTKVGDKILKGIHVRENITKQILTLQIPNAYFLDPVFRPQFEEGFNIQPARFLIKLVNRLDLDYYLTKEEITFFSMAAKDNNELDKVAQAIISYRKLSPEEKDSFKTEIASELEHRERSDNIARDFEKAHGDVAHTFMLLCDYTGLAVYDRGSALRGLPKKNKEIKEKLEFYDYRFPINKKYMISLQRMAESNGLDIDSFKIGYLSSEKPVTNRKKNDTKIKKLLSNYPSPEELTEEFLATLLKEELPETEAYAIASEIRLNVNKSLDDDFVANYLQEMDPLRFEEKTCNIFRMLGFEAILSPKPVKENRTEIEILLKYKGNQCGVIDAKNYKTKFILSSSLASLMATDYIPNYDGYDGCEIQFFGYISSSDFGGEINISKIVEICNKTMPGRDIKGLIMNAKTLIAILDWCVENNIPIIERADVFLKYVDNTGHRYLTY